MTDLEIFDVVVLLGHVAVVHAEALLQVLGHVALLAVIRQLLPEVLRACAKKIPRNKSENSRFPHTEQELIHAKQRLAKNSAMWALRTQKILFLQPTI